MKSNKGVLIVIILIIFNLLFGGILISTITSIKAPKIIAKVDILELNKNAILIQTKVEVYNPNYLSISVDNINVKCTNESNYYFGNIYIEGGEIEGLSNNTFIGKGNFSFENYNSEPIINEISADIEFNIIGIISWELPIIFSIVTDLNDIFYDFKPPDITINAEISEITENGINYIGDIAIYNPNNFDIIVDEISLTIETDKNDVAGEIEIKSKEVDSDSYKNFSINGNLSYSILNFDIVYIILKAKSRVKIAGFDRIINMSSTTEFKIPKVVELLMIDGSMDFSITGEFKFRINGILASVGLIVNNPSQIPLQASNLICTISDITDNNTRLLAENSMEPSSIPSKNEVFLTTDLTIPYKSIIVLENNKIFPDQLLITIKGDFSIEGTNQSIPISFNGFIDLNLFQ